MIHEITPLKQSQDSLSLQVQNHMLELLRKGVYKRGEKLPTELDLAAKLGVSRGTLREALNGLEQAGAIIRKHGAGTFVADTYGIHLQGELERHESVLDLAKRAGLETQYEELVVQEEQANPEMASVMQVDPGTLVTRVERVILASGRRVAFMRDVVSALALSPADINGSFRGSVLDLLRQKQRLQVSSARAKIEAINADEWLAKKLKIPAGRAILMLEEILFSEDGSPTELSFNYFIPEFFQFRVTRRYAVQSDVDNQESAPVPHLNEIK